MPRFAANLSMLYPELPFLDRFEAAARDGFEAVEFLFPYAHPAADIRARLADHGLVQALFNMPPGGTEAGAIERAWAAGDRGTACVPGREEEFRRGFALALHYAQVLQCPRLHVMAGLCEPAGRSEAAEIYETRLRWALNESRGSDIDLLIEPINPRDMPGYFLQRQDEAHAVVERIGLSRLKVQMDLYHCQIVEGDLAAKIRHYLPSGRVGHFQIAGVPDRHEPDIGEIDPSYLCRVIDEVAAECGWKGFVGCEYRPAGGAVPGATSRGLGWMRRALAPDGTRR